MKLATLVGKTQINILKNVVYIQNPAEAIFFCVHIRHFASENIKYIGYSKKEKYQWHNDKQR